MITKICERCDMEMRLVPAGVSKRTGNPYTAFWSCDKRNGGCGQTVSAEGEAAQAETGAQAVSVDRLEGIERKLDEILTLLQR